MNRYIILSIFVLYGSILNLSANSNLKVDFRGTIFDAENNSPVENAVIRVNELELSCISDKNGRFVFEGIPEGSFTIRVSRLGYRPEERKVKIMYDSVYDARCYIVPVGVAAPSLVITGEQYNNKFEELLEESSNLEGKDLQLNLSQTLAATLKNEAGLAVRSMGPAPARPVIRGLGGNRVVIEEDGIASNDLSATSPDHAVTIDIQSAEGIEIIRGPEVLTSTNTTIGGVVNVIKNAIPQSLPNQASGELAGTFETANNGWKAFAETLLPVGDFAVTGNVSLGAAGDIRAPGKTLENTAMNGINFNAGTSYIFEEGYIGGSFGLFSSNYGIPGGFVGSHPKGVDIEMSEKNGTFKGLYHFHNDFYDNMQVSLTSSNYHHKELEYTGSVGAEYVVNDISADIRLNHHSTGIFNKGTYGVSFSGKEQKMGGYVFTPNTSALSVATYLYEEMTFGRHYLRASLRYGYDSYNPEKEDPESDIGYIRARDFHLFSADISLMHETFENVFTGFDISRSTRSPIIEELYSEGPHLASYSFDVGNPDLSLEQGWGFELFTFYRYERTYLMITAFLNEMGNYIIPRNSGDTNYAQLLPIYVSEGVAARLMGGELHAEYELHENWRLTSTLSYTYGVMSTDNMPLPMIPPLKAIIDFRYSDNSYLAGLRFELASAQKRVDTYEEPTNGYVIAAAYFQYTFLFASFYNSLSLNIDNIFNTTYYNHLSRIKSIMPEPGINGRILWKMFI
jgi:iron complex outermembrane receptor protein